MNPLPSVNTAYQMIIRQERHVLIAQGKDSQAKVVAFAAHTTYKSSVVCTVCTKTCYSSSECFQILRYLEWWGDRVKNSSLNSSGRGAEAVGRNCSRCAGRNNRRNPWVEEQIRCRPLWVQCIILVNNNGPTT